jgi:uncharacterized protein (TIGR02284 family)
MSDTIAEQTKLEQLLEDLVRLERNAIAAYEHAIDRLREQELRSMLGNFCEDHQRHLRELGELLTGVGRQPAEQGDTNRLLTWGKVALGGLVGDTAVLKAMRSNEDVTNAAYDRAAAFADLPEEVRTMIQRAGDDERRHRDWITAKLTEI